MTSGCGRRVASSMLHPPCCVFHVASSTLHVRGSSDDERMRQALHALPCAAMRCCGTQVLDLKREIDERSRLLLQQRPADDSFAPAYADDHTRSPSAPRQPAPPLVTEDPRLQQGNDANLSAADGAGGAQAVASASADGAERNDQLDRRPLDLDLGAPPAHGRMGVAVSARIACSVRGLRVAIVCCACTAIRLFIGARRRGREMGPLPSREGYERGKGIALHRPGAVTSVRLRLEPFDLCCSIKAVKAASRLSHAATDSCHRCLGLVAGLTCADNGYSV